MDIKRNYGDLKIAILEILSDGEKRSVDEINNILNGSYYITVASKSHLYTALAQLINAGEPIVKIEKGIYKMEVSDTEIQLKEIEDVKKAILTMQNRLEKVLTYELSENEYGKYRKIYVLSKEYIRCIGLL